MGGQFSIWLPNFRKTGSVADANKGQHRSSFGIIPENIHDLWERHEDETGISRTSEIFCEDISQRIGNDPGLVDLNELNNVNHRGLCRASATLPVSRNLATKH